MARENEAKTLMGITGTGYTAAACAYSASNTDFASLPQNHACLVAYNSFLNAVSTVSGMDMRGTYDPWGRLYAIDENEGESPTSCYRDSVGTFYMPHVHNTRRVLEQIPYSGFSSCS